MSAMKFHVGDRVEDKKSHERGRVTFVYSTLELRDEVIAVLFNGHDEALAVPADSVRKVSTRQVDQVPGGRSRARRGRTYPATC